MKLVVMAPEPAAAALGESHDRFLRSCRVNGITVQLVHGGLGSEHLAAATREHDPDDTLVRACGPMCAPCACICCDAACTAHDAWRIIN